MKVKVERKSEVPISAMIDVVFLLLVFFIVTSTEVIDEAFVQVNAPGPVSGPATPMDTVDIYVLDSHYELMGKKYNSSEMEDCLAQIAQIMDQPAVNIKVAKTAKHKKLVRLLDSLNKVKLSKFSLHTLK